MPEPNEGAGAAGSPPASDFFDRLLARHVPAAPAARDVVRVRPRLAGPFERVEAVRDDRSGDPAPAGPAAGPLWPAAPRHTDTASGLRPAPAPLRTEHRRTVVRTEQAGEPGPGPVREVVREPSGGPLLRPAAPVRPAAVPGPATAAPGGGARRDDPGSTATPFPGGPVVDRVTAPALISPLPRPGSGDAATVARGAARAAAGRRAPRGGERTVHVQIGRLEVSAAGAADRRREEAPEGAGRRPAALGLDAFLRRDTGGGG